MESDDNIFLTLELYSIPQSDHSIWILCKYLRDLSFLNKKELSRKITNWLKVGSKNSTFLCYEPKRSIFNDFLHKLFELRYIWNSSYTLLRYGICGIESYLLIILVISIISPTLFFVVFRKWGLILSYLI